MAEPQRELQRQISELLERLLAIIATCDTESVLGWCFAYQFSTASGAKEEERLVSPAKQIPFLLSLLLSTPTPNENHSLTKEEWNTAKQILDELFQAYMQLYMPSKEQVGNLSEAWLRTREVAMSAFLHYYNTGLLASVEQIKDRIQRYVAPFDDHVKGLLGISPSDAITIFEWISKRLQDDFHKLHAAAAEEKAARLAMLNKAQEERWSLEKLREVASGPDYFDKASTMLDGLHTLGKVSIPELTSAFAEKGSALLSAYSIKRGDAPGMRYPTEEAVYTLRPLVMVSDEAVMCTSTNSIVAAILSSAEKALLNSDVKDAYLRYRDNELEREARQLLSTFLEPDARVYAEVFETPDSQFEHDVIAEDSRLQIVLEAKASPPKEPFRDPDKAFSRLRDFFSGDKGIQKAFEQANRVVCRLKGNEAVALYDRKGAQVAELKPDKQKVPVCICVTRDNFGMLATKLGLLLEKDPKDSFPWAVNVLDLTNLAMAWKYLKWGSKEFRQFLEQRALLHHKALADDELDIAGYFIRHGDFNVPIRAKGDVFHFNPDYSSIFDELYRHIYLGGPPVEIKQTEPVLMDLRKSLRRDEPVFLNPQTFKILDEEERSLRKARSREKKRREKAKERARKTSKARNRKKHG